MNKFVTYDKIMLEQPFIELVDYIGTDEFWAKKTERDFKVKLHSKIGVKKIYLDLLRDLVILDKLVYSKIQEGNILQAAKVGNIGEVSSSISFLDPKRLPTKIRDRKTHYEIIPSFVVDKDVNSSPGHEDYEITGKELYTTIQKFLEEGYFICNRYISKDKSKEIDKLYRDGIISLG